MKIGILNKNLKIMVVDSLDDLGYIQTQQLKKILPEGAEPNDLAFFYMPDRDWIVINKSHILYDFYSQSIITYLELSESGRKECVEAARKECVEAAPIDTIKQAFKILDDVILSRHLARCSPQRKEQVKTYEL